MMSAAQKKIVTVHRANGYENPTRPHHQRQENPPRITELLRFTAFYGI